MTWLHFIGKQYYTEHSFKIEAEKYGVSRRVDMRVLLKMKYGDRILLAIMDGKSPIVLGQFLISKITGLTDYAARKLNLIFEGTETDDFYQDVVVRGCGFYKISNAYDITTDLSLVADALITMKDEESEVGLPMIGGKFEELERVRLKDIPFRQGYRTFDWVKYKEEVEKERGRLGGNRITVRGQFYLDISYEPDLPKKNIRVESVKGYVRQNNKKKKMKELLQMKIDFD